jgi:hypothetical protein
MCDCRKRITENFKGKASDFIPLRDKNKAIDRVEFKELLFVFGEKTDVIMHNTLQIFLDGRSKPIDVNIRHTFCPFCGEKQIKETSTIAKGDEKNNINKNGDNDNG